MLDAETLFLVEHQKSQILKSDVAGQQAVGAYDEIDRAVFQSLQDLLLFLGRIEAVERGDAHAEIGESLAGGVEMLIAENGAGAHQRRLFAAQNA